MIHYIEVPFNAVCLMCYSIDYEHTSPLIGVWYIVLGANQELKYAQKGEMTAIFIYF